MGIPVFYAEPPEDAKREIYQKVVCARSSGNAPRRLKKQRRLSLFLTAGARTGGNLSVCPDAPSPSVLGGAAGSAAREDD